MVLHILVDNFHERRVFYTNTKRCMLYIQEFALFFKLLKMITYYVFHGRVTLFFANKSLTECRITMEFLHNFFKPWSIF